MSPAREACGASITMKRNATLIALILSSHNLERKEEFHRAGHSYLKSLAKMMGLQTGSYRVSSCKGGPAVMGEVILHTENLYMMLTNLDGEFLVRSCNGMKDYRGGPNRWVRLSKLVNPESLIECLASVTA